MTLRHTPLWYLSLTFRAKSLFSLLVCTILVALAEANETNFLLLYPANRGFNQISGQPQATDYQLENVSPHLDAPAATFNPASRPVSALDILGGISVSNILQVFQSVPSPTESESRFWAVYATIPSPTETSKFTLSLLSQWTSIATATLSLSSAMLTTISGEVPGLAPSESLQSAMLGLQYVRIDEADCKVRFWYRPASMEDYEPIETSVLCDTSATLRLQVNNPAILHAITGYLVSPSDAEIRKLLANAVVPTLRPLLSHESINPNEATTSPGSVVFNGYDEGETWARTITAYVPFTSEEAQSNGLGVRYRFSNIVVTRPAGTEAFWPDDLAALTACYTIKGAFDNVEIQETHAQFDPTTLSFVSSDGSIEIAATNERNCNFVNFTASIWGGWNVEARNLENAGFTALESGPLSFSASIVIPYVPPVPFFESTSQVMNVVGRVWVPIDLPAKIPESSAQDAAILTMTEGSLILTAISPNAALARRPKTGNSNEPWTVVDISNLPTEVSLIDNGYGVELAIRYIPDEGHLSSFPRFNADFDSPDLAHAVHSISVQWSCTSAEGVSCTNSHDIQLNIRPWLQLKKTVTPSGDPDLDDSTSIEVMSGLERVITSLHASASDIALALSDAQVTSLFGLGAIDISSGLMSWLPNVRVKTVPQYGQILVQDSITPLSPGDSILPLYGIFNSDDEVGFSQLTEIQQASASVLRYKAPEVGSPEAAAAMALEEPMALEFEIVDPVTGLVADVPSTTVRIRVTPLTPFDYRRVFISALDVSSGFEPAFIDGTLSPAPLTILGSNRGVGDSPSDASVSVEHPAHWSMRGNYYGLEFFSTDSGVTNPAVRWGPTSPSFSLMQALETFGQSQAALSGVDAVSLSLWLTRIDGNDDMSLGSLVGPIFGIRRADIEGASAYAIVPECPDPLMIVSVANNRFRVLAAPVTNETEAACLSVEFDNPIPATPTATPIHIVAQVARNHANDEQVLRVFVNGVQVSSSPQFHHIPNELMSSHQPLVVAQSDYPLVCSGWQGGVLHHISIWGTYLTDSGVIREYKTQLSPRVSTLARPLSDKMVWSVPQKGERRIDLAALLWPAPEQSLIGIELIALEGLDALPHDEDTPAKGIVAAQCAIDVYSTLANGETYLTALTTENSTSSITVHSHHIGSLELVFKVRDGSCPEELPHLDTGEEIPLQFFRNFTIRLIVGDSLSDASPLYLAPTGILLRLIPSADLSGVAWTPNPLSPVSIETPSIVTSAADSFVRIDQAIREALGLGLGEIRNGSLISVSTSSCSLCHLDASGGTPIVIQGPPLMPPHDLTQAELRSDDGQGLVVRCRLDDSVTNYKTAPEANSTGEAPLYESVIALRVQTSTSDVALKVQVAVTNPIVVNSAEVAVVLRSASQPNPVPVSLTASVISSRDVFQLTPDDGLVPSHLTIVIISLPDKGSIRLPGHADPIITLPFELPSGSMAIEYHPMTREQAEDQGVTDGQVESVCFYAYHSASGVYSSNIACARIRLEIPEEGFSIPAPSMFTAVLGNGSAAESNFGTSLALKGGQLSSLNLKLITSTQQQDAPAVGGMQTTDSQSDAFELTPDMMLRVQLSLEATSSSDVVANVLQWLQTKISPRTSPHLATQDNGNQTNSLAIAFHVPDSAWLLDPDERLISDHQVVLTGQAQLMVEQILPNIGLQVFQTDVGELETTAAVGEYTLSGLIELFTMEATQTPIAATAISAKIEIAASENVEPPHPAPVVVQKSSGPWYAQMASAMFGAPDYVSFIVIALAGIAVGVIIVLTVSNLRAKQNESTERPVADELEMAQLETSSAEAKEHTDAAEDAPILAPEPAVPNEAIQQLAYYGARFMYDQISHNNPALAEQFAKAVKYLFLDGDLSSAEGGQSGSGLEDSSDDDSCIVIDRRPGSSGSGASIAAKLGLSTDRRLHEAFVNRRDIRTLHHKSDAEFTTVEEGGDSVRELEDSDEDESREEQPQLRVRFFNPGALAQKPANEPPAVSPGLVRVKSFRDDTSSALSAKSVARPLRFEEQEESPETRPEECERGNSSEGQTSGETVNLLAQVSLNTPTPTSTESDRNTDPSVDHYEADANASRGVPSVSLALPSIFPSKVERNTTVELGNRVQQLHAQLAAIKEAVKLAADGGSFPTDIAEEILQPPKPITPPQSLDESFGSTTGSMDSADSMYASNSMLQADSLPLGSSFSNDEIDLKSQEPLTPAQMFVLAMQRGLEKKMKQQKDQLNQPDGYHLGVSSSGAASKMVKQHDFSADHHGSGDATDTSSVYSEAAVIPTGNLRRGPIPSAQAR